MNYNQDLLNKSTKAFFFCSYILVFKKHPSLIMLSQGGNAFKGTKLRYLHHKANIYTQFCATRRKISAEISMIVK